MRTVSYHIKAASFLFLLLMAFSCQERDGFDAELPVVTTAPVFRIGERGAETGGEVLGASDVWTTRGVVWSTEPSPTIRLTTKTIDGQGSGPFGSSVSKLEVGTTYYLRAYATNFKGTAYGNEVSFTTLLHPPQLQTHVATQITATTAVTGGFVHDCGLVMSRGVIWSTSNDLSISLETKTTDGGGIGEFTTTLTGLLPHTTYYIRSYAALVGWTLAKNGSVEYGPVEKFTTAP